MTSVYHSGELAVQQKAGAEIVARQNEKTVKPNIVKGAAAFLKTQSLLIAASVDRLGRAWTSFLSGEPGFIDVNNETTLTIQASPVANDPLIGNLASNRELGLLAIDFNKRIRLRINGTGIFETDRRLIVTTEQVYGNCPKYIQKRSLHPNGGYRRFLKSERRSYRLTLEQQEWIRQSDTFFIGSISSEGKMDASHRGGSPGFIKVDEDRAILFPDYFGNSMFNTLGNIHSNPNTGILFIDFDYGHSLQLTGQSAIIWDKEEISKFPGAERVVRFEITEILYTENNARFSWDFIEYSPANPTL